MDPGRKHHELALFLVAFRNHTEVLYRKITGRFILPAGEFLLYVAACALLDKQVTNC